MPQVIQLTAERGLDYLTQSLGTPTAALTRMDEFVDDEAMWENTDLIRFREYLEYVRLKPLFDNAERKLKDMANLLPDWNSYGADPPTAEARDRAAQALILLQQVLFPPNRIVPSSEGGVSVYFLRGERYADIEFLNTGETFAVTYVGATEPNVWVTEPGTLQATIARIVDHFAHK